MAENTTQKLEEKLHQLHSEKELDHYLQETELDQYPDFLTYFLSLPEVQKVSKSDLIRVSGIERTYAYQILNGQRIHPGRNRILMLCISAGLNEQETQRALKAGREPVLYAKTRRDAIILFAIQEKCSVMETNELLDSYHEQILD